MTLFIGGHEDDDGCTSPKPKGKKKQDPVKGAKGYGGPGGPNDEPDPSAPGGAKGKASAKAKSAPSATSGAEPGELAKSSVSGDAERQAKDKGG